jgi:hypothetical protein
MLKSGRKKKRRITRRFITNRKARRWNIRKTRSERKAQAEK